LDPETVETEAKGEESGWRTVLMVGRWLILVLSKNPSLRKEMRLLSERLVW